MATKPDKKPEWARVAEVDPVSGQNNYVEPSESKKDSGYTRAEIPPRQWINWLLKKCGEWIGYFEEVTDELIAQSGDFIALNYLIADTLYIGEKYDFSAQETSPRGHCFNSDGLKYYVVGTSSVIYQYSLSSPYEVDSASYDSISFDASSQATSAEQIRLSPDGTKLYVLDFTNRAIYQYTLSTADNVSTATYDSVSLDVSTEASFPRSFCFNSLGSKVYVSNNTDIYQYGLTTNYDMNTGSYDTVSLDLSAVISRASGIDFSDDGLKLAVTDEVDSALYQIEFTTGFDLGTAAYNGINFNYSNQDTSPREGVFNGSGTSIYMLGDTNNTTYQYRTSRVVGA